MLRELNLNEMEAVSGGQRLVPHVDCMGTDDGIFCQRVTRSELSLRELSEIISSGANTNNRVGPPEQPGINQNDIITVQPTDRSNDPLPPELPALEASPSDTQRFPRPSGPSGFPVAPFGNGSGRVTIQINRNQVGAGATIRF